MQITVGLARLGHDVTYLETTSDWPYDPDPKVKTPDSTYAVGYLARVAARFGLGDRWAYRRSYADNAWLGPAASDAERLLVGSDAVLNVAGATSLAEDGLAPPISSSWGPTRWCTSSATLRATRHPSARG